MTASLHPCSSCARHILSTEAACPFCGHAAAAAVPTRSLPRGRLSRAALIALGTIAASPAAACAGDVEEAGDGDGDMMGDGDAPNTGGTSGDGDMAGDGDNPVAVYGAPASGGLSNFTGGGPGTGGEANLGGMAGGDGSGGEDGGEPGTGGGDLGTGGDQVAPVYGIAPAYGIAPDPVD